MTWILGALLAAAAAAGITRPWWSRRAGAAAIARRDANVAAFRSRLDELHEESQAGVVPAEALRELRAELESRLVEDAESADPDLAAPPPARRLAAALGLALVAFAGGWYVFAGTWRTQSLIELDRRDPAAARVAALGQMQTQLERQTRRHPEDFDSWLWLSRTYREQERYADAAQAMARARGLRAADDPDLLVEEGENLLQAAQGGFGSGAAERFARALELAPEHPRALWYGGLAALHAGDVARALGLWQQLASQPDLEGDAREALQRTMAELSRRSGVSARAAAAPAPGFALRLRISVAPELRARIGPQHRLLVFAQADEGGMPLAVRRFDAPQLPLTTTLEDRHGVMPTRRLSSAERWRVVARLSASGGAQAEPGDLQGELRVDRAAAGGELSLVIDEVLK